MKQKLTIDKAEKIAREMFCRLENSEDKEFYILHSKLVRDIALILSDNMDIDKKILRIAGWVHDIGYSISAEEYAKHSLEILEKDFEIDETLADCILNHGSEGKPKTEEGKIIKVADKLFIFNPEIVSILLRYSLRKNKEEREKDL